MTQGHVYAARIPGAREVKIGMTHNRPEVRLRQLNNTSVLNDHEFEYLLSVSEPGEVEKAAHAMLANCRVRKDREYFRCSERKARSAINRAAARVGGRNSGSMKIGPGRRLLQLLIGTSLAIVGLVVTVVLLFVLYVDPVARNDYAGWMLGFVAVSGILLWSGFNLMRR